MSCGQPSVAAGPRQVQCTCTLRKILFAPQNRIFHRLAEIKSKCDSGLDREKKGLVQVRCTCRYPSAELGRTKYETSHFRLSLCCINLSIPAAVPPLQGRAPQEREPPELNFVRRTNKKHRDVFTFRCFMDLFLNLV